MPTKPRLSKAFTDETVAMVALAIVTLGVYNLIWSARAIRYVNSMARRKAVADWPLMVGAAAAGIQGYVLTVGIESNHLQTLVSAYQFSNFLDLVTFFILAFIAFQFRTALQHAFKNIGVRRKVSVIWTLLLGVIYINHVMRDVAENHRPTEAGEG